MVKCLRSNKDPMEVCNLYFYYLLIAKGIPQKLVAHRGKENVSIADSQRFRQNHSDNLSGYQSFQLGKLSTQYLFCNFVFDLYSALFRHVFQINIFITNFFKKKMLGNRKTRCSLARCFSELYFKFLIRVV